MSQTSKYKLYQIYTSNDNINWTPTDRYEADLLKECSKECGCVPIVTSITYDIYPKNISDLVECTDTSYTINYSGITIEHYNDDTEVSSVTFTGSKIINFEQNSSLTSLKYHRGTYNYNNAIGSYELTQGMNYIVEVTYDINPKEIVEHIDCETSYYLQYWEYDINNYAVGEPSTSKTNFVRTEIEFEPNSSKEEEKYNYGTYEYNGIVGNYTIIQPKNHIIGYHYDVYPSYTSATVDFETTYFDFNWSGLTIDDWCDGSETTTVTYTTRDIVRFEENSSTEDVIRSGKISWRGVNVNWEVTQGASPIREKYVYVNEQCYNNLPQDITIEEGEFTPCYTIIKYDSLQTQVVELPTIPNSYKKSDNWITSVTIGDCVESIGNSAFTDCEGIREVKIGDGVKYIGSDAFHNCTMLSNLTLPEGLEEIDDWAFGNASGLTSITIPDSVREIGYASFYNFALYSSCKTLTLGNSLYKIGKSAFEGLEFVTNDLNIPDSVKIIKPSAFRGLKRTNNVTIPQDLKILDDEVFGGCGLNSIIIPDSVLYLGQALFKDSSLSNVSIGSNVIKIMDDCFVSCGFSTVTIPASVNYLGKYAFGFCRNLTDIHFEGTKEQWQTIYIGIHCWEEVPASVVHCKDGDIELIK